MYLISGCLLGENCKYSGGNNLCEWVCEFAKEHSYMSVCPEMAGGLPTPRPPAEIRLCGGERRVFDREENDVTEAFSEGARKTLEAAFLESERRGESVEGAILRAGSPSCGEGRIYDGTFSGVKTEGDGVFVRLLKERKIPVINEEDESDIKKLLCD